MKRLIITMFLMLAGLSLAVAQTGNTPDTESTPSQPETVVTAEPDPAQNANTVSSAETVTSSETEPAQRAKTADEEPAPAKPSNPPTTAPAPAPAPERPESDITFEPVRKGDQFISFSLGIGKPLFNFAPGGIVTETNMKLGGTGSVGYSYFINGKVALGAELSFCFNKTIGENLLFYLPVTFKATYEFVYKRIHLPVSLGAGFAFQTYNHVNYFGPILKPEAGVYYQFNPEWSFGILTAWSLIPEWYKDPENNRTGNFLDVKAGLRYHF